MLVRSESHTCDLSCETLGLPALLVASLWLRFRITYGDVSALEVSVGATHKSVHAF